MNKKTKDILRILSLPLTFVVVYLILALIWKVFALPTDEKLVSIVSSLFNHYGLVIILVSAFIEGLLLLGQYFPGSFVIFLGVISAGKDVVRASEVVGVVSIAFFFAYLCNYLLGKYGWYRLFIKFGLKNSIDRTKKKLQKHVFKTFILGYWAPDFATITATAAGVLKLPLKTFLFYSTISLLFWNIVWGTIVFTFGMAALKAVMGVAYVLIILTLWVAILLIRHFFFNKK